MTRLAAPLTVLLVTALVVASLVPIEPPRQF